MKTIKFSHIKKHIYFTLILLPLVAVGGYFSGIYVWNSLSTDIKSQTIEQLGSSQLFFVITAFQTMIFTAICGVLGGPIADRLGLNKPFKIEKKSLIDTTILTLVIALILCSDIVLFSRYIPQAAEVYTSKPSFAFWISSILYGGIFEEIMMRWFFMSLIAFLLWKIFCRKEVIAPIGVIVFANIVAAILFAAGHLPATFQMFGEITPLILFRCILLNGVVGLILGRIYRKNGIVYAMMAHAGAHILWKIVWILTM